jgi:hypothetical protein
MAINHPGLRGNELDRRRIRQDTEITNTSEFSIMNRDEIGLDRKEGAISAGYSQYITASRRT